MPLDLFCLVPIDSSESHTAYDAEGWCLSIAVELHHAVFWRGVPMKHHGENSTTWLLFILSCVSWHLLVKLVVLYVGFPPPGVDFAL